MSVADDVREREANIIVRTAALQLEGVGYSFRYPLNGILNPCGPTDYDHLLTLFGELGAEPVSTVFEMIVGVEFQLWELDGVGLIVGHHLESGGFGLYDFVGRQADPVSFDLEYLKQRHKGAVALAAVEDTKPVEQVQ